jgi:excisionase family DNA binding protein
MTTTDKRSGQVAEWISVREAAKLLQLHPQTVYAQCQTGGIPAVRIGSQWRINREQLLRRLLAST